MVALVLVVCISRMTLVACIDVLKTMTGGQVV